jgi:hypothetical protein
VTDTADDAIRIASGQGFWGDDLEAPVRQVERGPIDYLMMDYLAEVTMSIMQKQRARDPSAGYARDFVPLMKRILPACVERDIRVVTNAGGVNPRGCAEALVEAGREVGVGGKARVAMVTGDDLMDRLDDLLAAGHALEHMETGEPLSTVRDHVQSANVYIGGAPIVEALRQDARVVVTGRSTDTALTYGPMMHAFGWSPDDYDRLAAGVVAGHINECGAQCSGGNCLIDWWDIPDMADVGFPIIEVRRHQARGDGRPGVPGHRHRADRLRDGRSGYIHHSRRDRRLHDDPPGGGGLRPRTGSRGEGQGTHALPEGVHRLLQRLEGRGHPGLHLARRGGQGPPGRRDPP